jgi:hypothetical protein
MKMRFVTETTVIDPDTLFPVEVSVYKTDGGGMVGIDSSFLQNTDEPIYSPFDYGVVLEEESDAVL